MKKFVNFYKPQTKLEEERPSNIRNKAGRNRAIDSKQSNSEVQIDSANVDTLLSEGPNAPTIENTAKQIDIFIYHAYRKRTANEQTL